MKRLVPVSPWPMHPKVAEVLEAIEGIVLVQALPGGPGPILAIGKAPAFVCDAIVVKSPEKAAQAVDIIISNGLELVTVRDMVEEALGVDVKEWEQKVDSKVRFR